MRRPRIIIEDEGPKVPGYIVTFSDMVTLLLTFFVMLLTLANVQDPELFNKGRDSFLESLRCIGLGALFGRKDMPHFGELKDKHFVPDPDEEPPRRTIDAKAEEIRRLIEQIKQHATIVPLQISAKRTDFSVVNVQFSSGDAALDESAKKFLTGFCQNLQQDANRGSAELYVLGLAGDETSGKGQWVLSAKRAQAVADFLRRTLSSESGIYGGRSGLSIRSWGAGPGGDWVGRNGPVSRQSQVLIGVIRPED